MSKTKNSKKKIVLHKITNLINPGNFPGLIKNPRKKLSFSNLTKESLEILKLAEFLE